MNTDEQGYEGKSKKVKGKISASLCLCGAILFLAITVAAQTKDYAKWVNPFIGTGGHGHTFPGATLPFGMVQLSPDTRIDNWDGSSGYHYSDNIIYGFSHTHLSGTGIPDGCDILFMPTVGIPRSYVKATDDVARADASSFSHAREKAEPGYYSVFLDNSGVHAELTATTRVGLHRYIFPAATENANILLDLRWRDRPIKSELRIRSDRRIEGSRHSSSWAKNQKIFFVAEFSKPMMSSSLGAGLAKSGDIVSAQPNADLRAYFRFATAAGEAILLKVGVSFVSIEGARKNLEAELPHWDFDKVRADAKAAWNKELSKIEVSGGTDDQTTNFYTALYHTMIQPNVFNDVDGSYIGHDKKIHRVGGSRVRLLGPERSVRGAKSDHGLMSTGMRADDRGDHYTVFSLWDTFRAAHPLYTIIDQKRTVDFINTFIRIYEQGGRLPVWELWGEETDTMIGYHAVSVIADAMAKGIKGFDYEKAYAAAKHSAELDHFGLAAYKRRGYISMEDENESVSRTLEYAYNDWCIEQMSLSINTQRALKYNYSYNTSRKDPIFRQYGREAYYYAQRAGSFENLFDPSTGFMRPKKNGGFVQPFAPNEVTFGFTEGNSWQYSFFVPHDVPRLMELMGGREKFAAKLDELFTTDQKLTGRDQPDITGLIGQYAHGNEPSHHIPYLFNYAREPWKTQKYVRKIMDEFYKNAPDGLIGNEDCGQMSAWYVLSAIGFYPISPGSGSYEIGTPLFKNVRIKLENGKIFTVKAPNVSAENIYVNSVKINGRELFHFRFLHLEFGDNAVLEFDMTNLPSKKYEGLGKYYRNPFVAVPLIEGGGQVFEKGTTITLSATTPETTIFYTTDGSEPTGESTRYVSPFSLTDTATVKAIAVNSDGLKSLVAEAKFAIKPNDWTVKVISGYSTQYTGGGDNAIIDGIRGTTNFASGEWQGVQGKPYEAVVDLQRETEIKELGASFLQVASPWIWMPDRVEFEVSPDGVNFTRVAEIKPAFPQREMTPTIKEYRQNITATRARYVRMRAFNFGKIPAWHPGAGGDPWIFIDEIFVGTA